MIVLTVETLIQIFYWKIVPVYLLNSLVKGFFVAFDIFLIVFGAVFFLEVLKNLRVIENIGFYLESVAKDFRVQTILLAWFFINFIEGMAGFGTPGAVVAPILISLGLSPMVAVVISVLGNSSAGAFGAVGTPIRVGFAGLDTTGVPWNTVWLNAVGILIPVFMILVLAREEKENRRQFFFEILPFALWSGFLFVLSSVLTVGFGQEFVSVIGSLAAIILVVLTTKKGIFVPKNVRVLRNNRAIKMTLPLKKVLLPYLLVFVLLLVGKLTLKSVVIHFPWDYQYSLNLFNPGVIFFVAGLPLVFLWHGQSFFKASMKTALVRTVDPFIVILGMSTMTQMIVNSGNNYSGLPSVLFLMAENLRKDILPFVAPFIGAFGTMISGSVTISNILFGNILFSASRLFGIESAKILSLEISGAAMGNTMAIADIMAAEAVTGMENKTRNIMARVVGPCMVCLLILGVVGLFIVR